MLIPVPRVQSVQFKQHGVAWRCGATLENRRSGDGEALAAIISSLIEPFLGLYQTHPLPSFKNRTVWNERTEVEKAVRQVTLFSQ